MTVDDDEFAAPASIDEALSVTIEDLAGAERLDEGGSALLTRAGRPFAGWSDESLEVRLDPLVAVAALRTPDTTPSGRGIGWIRFTPGELDRYAVDRATAWLGHAWRHALD